MRISFSRLPNRGCVLCNNPKFFTEVIPSIFFSDCLMISHPQQLEIRLNRRTSTDIYGPLSPRLSLKPMCNAARPFRIINIFSTFICELYLVILLLAPSPQLVSSPASPARLWCEDAALKTCEGSLECRASATPTDSPHNCRIWQLPISNEYDRGP